MINVSDKDLKELAVEDCRLSDATLLLPFSVQLTATAGNSGVTNQLTSASITTGDPEVLCSQSISVTVPSDNLYYSRQDTGYLDLGFSYSNTCEWDLGNSGPWFVC